MCFGYRTDKHTDENRCESTGQRVDRAAGLQKLVAFFTAAAYYCEHGVDYSVEHTYTETAYECAEQVNYKN